MLPHAEINTAGVIIAVNTVMAEDKGFTGTFDFEGSFIEPNPCEGNVMTEKSDKLNQFVVDPRRRQFWIINNKLKFVGQKKRAVMAAGC